MNDLPKADMLSLRFDPNLPNDFAFAQIVVRAAEHFQLTPAQVRETLKFLVARNEIPETNAPSKL